MTDRDRPTRLAHVAAVERALARWGTAHAVLVASLTEAHNRVLARSCVDADACRSCRVCAGGSAEMT